MKVDDIFCEILSMCLAIFFQLFTIVLWGLTWANFGYGLWEWYNNVRVPLVNLVSPLLVGVGFVSVTISKLFCSNKNFDIFCFIEHVVV